jgi:hypothetical protein
MTARRPKDLQPSAGVSNASHLRIASISNLLLMLGGRALRNVGGRRLAAPSAPRYDAVFLRLSEDSRPAIGVLSLETPGSRDFRGWAIQDSNLGPLPYQGRKSQ